MNSERLDTDAHDARSNRPPTLAYSEPEAADQTPAGRSARLSVLTACAVVIAVPCAGALVVSITRFDTDYRFTALLVFGLIWLGGLTFAVLGFVEGVRGLYASGRSARLAWTGLLLNSLVVLAMASCTVLLLVRVLSGEVIF